MDRILIVGLPGSGKSTFANKLGKKLNIETIHLDKFYYPVGWAHTQTKEEWRETVKTLSAKDKWVMDGNFHSTLDIRMPRADVIIFLDFNKLLCLYRIFKRVLTTKGQPFDKSHGNKEKVTWNLVMKIVKFRKQKTLQKIEMYADSKKIYILKSSKEVEYLLNQIS